MKIGIVKEIKPSEYRVAATPAAVVEMVRKGHEVYVEHDAGVGSGFTDEMYETAGAKIVNEAEKFVREAPRPFSGRRIRCLQDTAA